MELELELDRPVVGRLAGCDPGIREAAVDRKGEAHDPIEGRRPALVRAETELGGSPQRERPAGLESDADRPCHRPKRSSIQGHDRIVRAFKAEPTLRSR
jgi:hypothetical protein